MQVRHSQILNIPFYLTENVDKIGLLVVFQNHNTDPSSAISGLVSGTPFLKEMAQDVPSTGNGPGCSEYRECPRMFRVQGMAQDVPSTGNGPGCSEYREWPRMFRVQGMAQDVPSTGNGPGCSEYREWPRMFRVQGMSFVKFVPVDQPFHI